MSFSAIFLDREKELRQTPQEWEDIKGRRRLRAGQFRESLKYLNGNLLAKKISLPIALYLHRTSP